MAVRAVVVDDEPHARADLVRALVSLGVEIVGEAADGPSALRVIERERPAIVFLDIELPGLDGISLAARGDLPPIVFVTAHAAHAPRAFDLDAVDYVLKPATPERLARALSRAARRVELEDARLRVTDGKGTRYVDPHRVEVFSAGEKYVSFTLDGDEHLLRTSLDDLEARLDGFVRAHRAHLVRKAAVTRTEDAASGLVLVLASGARIPVSKRLRTSVLRALS